MVDVVITLGFATVYPSFFTNTLGMQVLLYAGLLRIAVGSCWPRGCTRAVLALAVIATPSNVILSLTDAPGPPHLVPVVRTGILGNSHRAESGRGEVVLDVHGCTTTHPIEPKWALVW